MQHLRLRQHALPATGKQDIGKVKNTGRAGIIDFADEEIESINNDYLKIIVH